MRVKVVWPRAVLDILENIPAKNLEQIARDVALLAAFPKMYPVKRRGTFRGHRWFACGEWLIFYRFASGTVFIRAVWPARIPVSRSTLKLQ